MIRVMRSSFAKGTGQVSGCVPGRAPVGPDSPAFAVLSDLRAAAVARLRDGDLATIGVMESDGSTRSDGIAHQDTEEIRHTL